METQLVANRYELDQELGRGGMAIVYRAIDKRLNRAVALKLLHPYLANQPESAARFTRESEAIAKLHHPNIVEIFDAGVDEQTKSHFIVMELIEGPTLNAFIVQHPTKIPEIALAMGCSLCDAIAHAHQANIIHRDIKPENIMISGDGVIKLMDFGIARILDAERMTASGSLVGSPAHMPPEIIEGQQYSYPCDIFSLGTVIYYALTNQLPFTGATPMSVFKMIIGGDYPRPSRVNPAISESFDEIIGKCLETTPDARYQTVADLKAAMLALLEKMQMSNYGEELREYFADPDDYNRKKTPGILVLLNDSARQDIDENRIPAAINKINRVLAYESDNANALALMCRVRHRGDIRRRVIISIASVAAILLILGAALVLPGFLHSSDGLSDADAHNDAMISAKAPESSVTVLPDTEIREVSPNHPDEVLLASNVSSSPMVHDAYREIIGSFHPTQHPESAPVPETPASDGNAHADQPPAVSDNGTETADSHDNAGDADNAGLHASDTSKTGSNRVRTPKKVRETEGDTDKPTQQDVAQPTQPAAVENMPAAATVKVTQPIYPPDGFAVVNGKRYESNSSGDIVMDLAPGRYSMTLSCPRRCVPAKSTLIVKESSTPIQREIVSLDWADASLSLYGPEGRNLYFVARRLDDHTNRVFHLVARAPNAVADFNAFGKPIQLEVYAIPTSNTLKSYDINALERAKYASTRVSLSPGESRTIRF